MADNYLEKKMEQHRAATGAQAGKSRNSLATLLERNRSTRGYDSSFIVRPDQLRRIVAVNTKVASARNRQVLRFRLVAADEAHKVLPHISMGAALSEMQLPLPGTEPNAFIIVCSSIAPRTSTYIDLGISVQSMLLQATEIGLNGLCILSFDKERIMEALGLSLEPLMVVAIGKSAEKHSLVDISASEPHDYYRNSGVHYVPKVRVDDLIIK
jgi:nitroreductase